MTLAEYLVGLTTIVTGVALTDLIQRTGALIEHRREIRWDWMPFLFAIVAILTLVAAWSAAWQTIQRNPQEITLGRFFMALADYVLLYLMCAATLPRDPQPGIDLRGFFECQTRPYWILFSLLLTYFGFHEVFLPALTGTARASIAGTGIILVAIAIAIALTFASRRLWHALGGLLLLGILATNLTLTF